MSAYVAPPRAPDALTRSDLPDWAVRVWIAIRATQGDNGEAWARYPFYADRAGKSVDMVRKAVGVLKRAGWIEEVRREGNTRVLRCLVPPSGGAGGREQGSRSVRHDEEQRSRSVGADREQGSQVTGNGVPAGREQDSSSPTPPSKEQSEQESREEAGARARDSWEGEGQPDGTGPVDEYRRAFPGLELADVQLECLDGMTDVSAFQKALEYWRLNGHKGESVGKFADRYRRIAEGEGGADGRMPRRPASAASASGADDAWFARADEVPIGPGPVVRDLTQDIL